MAFTVHCRCGTRFRISAELLGKQVTCPACGRTKRVPVAADTARSGDPGADAPRSPVPVQSRRTWPWVAVTALLLLLIGIGASWLWPGTRRDARPPDQGADAPRSGSQGVNTPRSPAVESPRQAQAELPQRKGNVTEEGPELLPLPLASSSPPASIAEPPSKPPAVGVAQTEPTKPSQEPASVVPPKEQPHPGLAKSEPAGPASVKESAKPPPMVAGRPKESPPSLCRWTEGETLYQEVVVTQKPRYSIQGLEVKSELQFTFVSSLKVTKKHADGGMVVEQKIESAKLDRGDPLTQGVLEELLKELPGAIFKITLDAQMQVVKLEGGRDLAKAAAGGLLGNQNFLLLSVLDQDAWKELAQLTFFMPNRPLRSGVKWEQKMTHNWGPLGSWVGKVTYTYQGERDGLYAFAFVRGMVHVPPKGGAGPLPFQIMAAAFKVQDASGTIHIDPARGKVVRAQERFHVQGQLTISYLGQPVPVAIEEEQIFQLRLLERSPLAK